MFLQQIEVAGFRNLLDQRLCFSTGFNIFYGANGSGKTSILEAIHVLGAGRSFRTTNLFNIIQHGRERYALGGIVAQNDLYNQKLITNIGVEKTRTGGKSFRLAGKSSSAAAVARMLPVQAIGTDSHKLIDAGPEHRRKFVDWAVFHMEHDFWEAWQAFKVGLAQRNSILKASVGRRMTAGVLTAWQGVFVEAAIKVDAVRKQFLGNLMPVAQAILQAWLPGRSLELKYSQGWAEAEEFAATLEANLSLDLMLGFTSKGPHRADIDIMLDGAPAKEFLSRGQQKLLVCALLLARSQLLVAQQQKRSIFLFDDLHAELDENSSRRLLAGLGALQSQVFITNIAREAILRCLAGVTAEARFFAVETGKTLLQDNVIAAVDNEVGFV